MLPAAMQICSGCGLPMPECSECGMSCCFNKVGHPRLIPTDRAFLNHNAQQWRALFITLIHHSRTAMHRNRGRCMRQVRPVSVHHLPPRMPPFSSRNYAPRELFVMRAERFARCFTMMCKACAIDCDWNLSKKIVVRQLLDCYPSFFSNLTYRSRRLATSAAAV